jgi:hypothetical protein
MRRNATRGEIGVAVVLLLGVLALAYGYFQQSKIGFYGGLVVTAAGVLISVLRIVMRGNR